MKLRAFALCLSVFIVALASCGLVDGSRVPAATCAEWARLDADDQFVVTERLVGDRLDTVRQRQQLPAAATRAEIVAAALGSIDKVCQGEGPNMRPRDIVADLYR